MFDCMFEIYKPENVDGSRVTAKDLQQDLTATGVEVSVSTARSILNAESFHARTPEREVLHY